MAEKKETVKTTETELVDVYLFEDGDKYRDDVFVAVNGKTYQIKRGEHVKVPKFVKEVLDNSMKQDREANRYMREQEEQSEKKMKEIEA